MIVKELSQTDFQCNIKEITDLFKISFKASFPDISLNNDFYDQKVHQAYSFLCTEDATILGAFDDSNKLCAFAYIYKTLVFDKDYIHLNHIAVFPEYQHKGIGKKLLDYIFDKSVRENINTIKLDVSTCNRSAVDFYHNLDFKPTRYQMEKVISEEICK